VNDACVPFCDEMIQCASTAPHRECYGGGGGTIIADGDSYSLGEVEEWEYCEVVQGEPWDEEKRTHETEECQMVCSAALLMDEERKSTWSALMDCVAAHAGNCDEIGEACKDEAEAAGAALGDIFGSKTGAGSEGDLSGDDVWLGGDAVQVASADVHAVGDSTGADTGTTQKKGSGGSCAVDAPGSPSAGLFLLLLAVFAALGRRLRIAQ